MRRTAPIRSRIQLDGKIVVASSDFTNGNGGVVRYNSDGTRHFLRTNGFASIPGFAFVYGQAVALAPDGSGEILVGGSDYIGPNQQADLAVARLMSNGQMVNSFGKRRHPRHQGH